MPDQLVRAFLYCGHSIVSSQSRRQASYILVAACLALLSIPVMAANVFVASSGSNTSPYDTWAKAATNIQTAIDAAGTSDQICVKAGTYTITTQLTIDGADPANLVLQGGYVGSGTPGTYSTNAALTILDAGDVDGVRVMDVSNTTALVHGFTLTGGKFTSSTTYGSGLNLADGVVSNCIISDNYAYHGNVQMYGGTLTHSIVANNLRAHPSASSGTGIRIPNNSEDALVTYCLITNNLGGGGAGIYAQDGTIRNCIIRDNIAGYRGAGVCLYNNAVMEDCLIANNTAGSHGGGVFSQPASKVYGYRQSFCLMRNCVVVGNQSSTSGGGIYALASNSATNIMRNCLIVSNSASVLGGGIYAGSAGSVPRAIWVDNCTVSDNSALNAGSGVYQEGPLAHFYPRFRNTIVYFNTGGIGDEVNQTNNFTYSCCPKLTAGQGNTIDDDPVFTDRATGDYRFSVAGPCVDTGTNLIWMGGAIDLDGASRIINSTVDMGPYEADVTSGPFACSLLTPTNTGVITLEAVFTASVGGGPDPNRTNVVYYWWEFNGGSQPSQEGAGKSVVTNTFGPGVYDISLTVSNALDEVTSVTRPSYISVLSDTNYVSLSGSHEFPYMSWSTAATNIQSAIDAAYVGPLGNGTILVADGTYDITSEIMLTKDIILRSQNGPESAIIDAGHVDGRRVIRVGSEKALLCGFTITGGYLSSSSVFGAGVYLVDGTVSNCVITGNQAYHAAGMRIEDGRATQSTIANNTREHPTASGGTGIHMGDAGTGYDIVVEYCTITNNLGGGGGGILSRNGTIRNCLIENNNVGGNGAGAWIHNSTVIRDCVIRNNQAGSYGGGIRSEPNSRIYGQPVDYCLIDSCVIVSNSAANGGGLCSYSGNQATNITRNCLIISNTATSSGGGVYSYSGGSVSRAAWMDNCTIAGNSAAVSGSGLYQEGPGTPFTTKFRNMIVYHNDEGVGDDLNLTNGFSFSCAPGLIDDVDGNISVDPMFIKAPDNYRIHTRASPCRNVGTNLNWIATNSLDIAGGPRIMHDIVDMGAYEVEIPAAGSVLTIR